MRLRNTLLFSAIAATGFSGCAQTAIVNAENLCKDWRHQTVSKSDKLTEKTASQIEASNESRPTWGCKYGENKSKG